SGVSNWKFKTIDGPRVAKLGVPGAVGAFIGATGLSGRSTEAAVPITATILLAIGIYVALRFSVRPPAVTD
ncbi:sulfite exporter TauE/SafE family protein, partial [Rhodococcus sp. IEGM 1406]|nr:sulfite exporter TauE/SafE family protein [Rhodococcus sp. IEGM 1406]